MQIGYEGYSAVFGASYWLDGLITDLAIWNTADTSTTHYTTGRPYYEPECVANEDRSVIIGRSGVRLNNASIIIADKYNRQMRISNADGMMAKDAAGRIIHDIPNAVIQTADIYCGHAIWFAQSVYSASQTSTTNWGVEFALVTRDTETFVMPAQAT